MAAGLLGGLNPQMLQQLMPILAGAGLRDMVDSISKLHKTMSGGAAQGHHPGQQAGGPQGATMPMGASAAPPVPAGAMPGGAPPAGAQPQQQQIMALMAMLRAKGLLPPGVM